MAHARRYARGGDEEEEVQVLDGRVGRDATVVSLLVPLLSCVRNAAAAAAAVVCGMHMRDIVNRISTTPRPPVPCDILFSCGHFLSM